MNKKEFQLKYFDLIKYLHLFGVSVQQFMTDKYGLLSCLDCCGGELYVASGDKICCNEVLYQKPDNAECCREEPIDGLIMICCEGVPQSRPRNGACCGQEAYDQRRQYCCSGEILQLEADATSADVTPIISKTFHFLLNRIVRFIDNTHSCAFVHSNTVITCFRSEHAQASW